MKIFSKIPHLFLPLAFCAVLGTVFSCAKPTAGASASNQNLKEALVALDQGNEEEAIKKLDTSLKLDSANSKARIMLASIYAKRAGIGLQDWLEPLINAGQQIESKSRTYDQLRGVLDRLAGVQEEVSHSASEQYEPDLIKKRASEVALRVGRASLGIVIAVDMFSNIPYLDSTQLVSLDKAINLLKEDNPVPESRKEEVRVYLTILSFVRVVHFTREIIGTSELDVRNVFTSESKICGLSLPEAKPRIYEIRNSLLSLKEGLAVGETEPQNKYREARKKIHNSLDKELNGVDWKNINNYLEDNTIENRGTVQFIRQICKFVTNQASGGKNNKPVGFKPGAELFDPDAE